MISGRSLHTMILVLFVTLLTDKANGTDLIFPGIQSKISAGAGQTVSRGPSALFYNPANLIFSKFIEPYADISFAKVSYQYQHTETETYDPAVIDVTAPPITIGLGFRPVPSFALGVAFFPTGSGAIQLIESVPIHLQDGIYKLSDVINKQSSSKIAAGAAFRFAFPFTVGLGLIRTTEDIQTQIFPVGSEDALFDAAYKGSANQFLLGMRSELFDRYLVLALSYRTAAEKKYIGDIITSLAPGETNEFAGVGYVPGAIGFGLETKFSSIGLFLDFVRETWSGGRTVFKRGFGPEPDEYDFIDSNNISLGLKWWVAPKHMIQVGFGSHGANMGDGTEVAGGAELQEEASLKIAGPSFGSLDAIPRTILSAGYRAKITGNGYFQTGVHYQTGTRIIPEGYAQEGQYVLKVMLLTLGLAYGF
jgi:hypothetical protein